MYRFSFSYAFPSSFMFLNRDIYNSIELKFNELCQGNSRILIPLLKGYLIVALLNVSQVNMQVTHSKGILNQIHQLLPESIKWGYQTIFVYILYIEFFYIITKHLLFSVVNFIRDAFNVSMKSPIRMDIILFCIFAVINLQL